MRFVRWKPIAQRLQMLAVVAAIMSGASAVYDTSAEARPVLRLSLPGAVEGGQNIPFTYSATSGARHNSIFLQRQMGSAHFWHTVMPLRPSRHGTADTSGLPMGVYRYRIASVSHGKLLAAGRTAVVRSYANIPFGRLAEPDVIDVESGSVVVGGNTFNYLIHINVGQDGQYLMTSATTCRSLHVEAATPAGGPVGWAWKVALTQQTLDPVSLVIEPGQITSFTADVIAGQSWSIGATLEKSNPNLYIGHTLYLNGYANCYAITPLAGPS